MKFKKESISDENHHDSTRFNAKKWSKMIQNVKITSILTTFILLMIKDRNNISIGFWRIFSTTKIEKIPFYLKLVKFLCLV